MPDCPTPARGRYRSEGAAWSYLRGLRMIGGMLPYRCGDHWHVTLAAEARAKRAAGRA